MSKCKGEDPNIDIAVRRDIGVVERRGVGDRGGVMPRAPPMDCVFIDPDDAIVIITNKHK